MGLPLSRRSPKGRAEPALYGASGGCHLRDASVQADRTRDRGADERARKTLANIAEYNEILSNRAAMAKVIIRELEAYKRSMADRGALSLTISKRRLSRRRRLRRWTWYSCWIALAMRRRSTWRRMNATARRPMRRTAMC